MALYAYVKGKPTYRRVRKLHSQSTSTRHLSAKTFVSTTLGFAGLFLIIWVSYPIISFEVMSRFKYPSSPIASSFNWEQLDQARANQAQSEVLAAAQDTESTQQESRPQEAPVAGDGTQIDYTKASNWFPDQPQSHLNLAGRIYFLSIPKLKIVDATVKIAGEDLNKSLIHYGGTGLPGDYGAAVIFGHSILPQFYDPRNYKAIFSLLPKLKEGDEIFAKYDGVTYRYVVKNMRVTTPNDISILEQRYDSSYLKLITCVPPGTYWKRLEITAQLETL